MDLPLRQPTPARCHALPTAPIECRPQPAAGWLSRDIYKETFVNAQIASEVNEALRKIESGYEAQPSPEIAGRSGATPHTDPVTVRKIKSTSAPYRSS